METRTFGRRGLDRPKSPAAARALGFADVPQPRRAEPSPLLRDDDGTAPGDMSMTQALDLLPVLTLLLCLVLAAVFALQTRLAFDLGRDSRMSHESLMAFGAASRDLVFGGGEWWRVFTAPLLHADVGHLGGNLFALAIVGVRLESLIGRAWLAAIFVFSGLAGMAGSFLGNPPELITVGASGAIIGVVAALFVMSLTRVADPATARSIRSTALYFGGPALAPLAFGGGGGTDWFAHLGGAIGGASLGLAMLATWRPGAPRPSFGREAATFAGAVLAIAIGSGLIGAIDYGRWAARAVDRIPQSAMPTGVDLSAAEDAVRRWPKDPRGRLTLGVALLADHRPAAAEDALNAAIDLAAADPTASTRRVTTSLARAYLTLALAAQGRIAEARVQSTEVCDAGGTIGRRFGSIRKSLVKLDVCR
ncbi:MAG: rhomboid family intramembrane serine protease [Hyphomicrobiales bacterium]|nr:rhomboid family intramembrane serine protease [Hyphomicrobiales bacterium]